MKKYLDDIDLTYDIKAAIAEASRCLLCIDAPCSLECPAKTDPAKFIRSLRFLNFKGGAEVIRKNNALGAVCARVCPEEKYCQKGCLRSGIDRPIQIGLLQKFLTDFEMESGLEVYDVKPSTNKKIAIIGSGPSGLQAATTLSLLGHQVTIYEKEAKLGGYLRYGIPEFRLSNQVIDVEVERILKLGVKVVKNHLVTNLEKLQKQYDAVIVASGLSKGRELAEFKRHKNSVIAVDFLKEVKVKQGELTLPSNVLVIGGGDVAMDVNSTLKLLGVKQVTNVIYETFDELRASQKEFDLAVNLKTSLIDGYEIQEVLADEVIFRHRKIQAELKVKADLVILAVGQVNETTNLGLSLSNEPTNAHLGDNLFITGDLHQGDKTVVYAIKLGKEVAELVNQFLGGQQ